MSRVVVQMGHCFRKRGATGTHREQEFVSQLGPRIKELVELKGVHTVEVILADQYGVAPADLFLALHCDGSTSNRAHGASVGYPSYVASESQVYAQLWKYAHRLAGYRWGFRPDNYTAALRRYYYYDNIKAPARLVIEHGFLTTPVEERWLFANVDRVAAGHALAIDAYFGTLNQPPTEPEDPDMALPDFMMKLNSRPDIVAIWGDKVRHIGPAEFARYNGRSDLETTTDEGEMDRLLRIAKALES